MSARYAPPIISLAMQQKRIQQINQEDVRTRAITAMQQQRAALLAAGVKSQRLPEVHGRMSKADLEATQQQINDVSTAHGIPVAAPTFPGQAKPGTRPAVPTFSTPSAPPVPDHNPGSMTDEEAAAAAGMDAPSTATPMAARPMARPFATGQNSGGVVTNPNISAATFDGMRTTETPAGAAKVYDPRDDQGIIPAPTAPGQDRSVYVPQKYGGGTGSVNYGPAPTSSAGRLFDETGDVTANFVPSARNAPAAPTWAPEAETAPPPQAPNPSPMSTPLGSTNTEDDIVGKFSENRFDNQFKKSLMYAGRFS